VPLVSFFLCRQGDPSPPPPPPPPPGPDPCSALTTVAPAASTVFGEAVPERPRGLVVGVAGMPVLDWTLADPAGRPIDLAACGVPFTVALRAREALGGTGVVAYAGSASSPAEGRLSVTLDLSRLGGPGVYDAEVAAVGDGGRVLASNAFALLVEASLFAEDLGPGPPSAAEIRLQLRDSSPAEHRLIDTVTFDAAELALALKRPVRYWNEAPPPLDRSYTTLDFPHRYHWIEGAIAELFRIQAEYYRKNHLAYQAGGLAVDDLAKFQEYQAAADARWAAYRAWVQQQKIGLNLADGFGVEGSGYALGGSGLW
jgi:hypothetical protein